MAEAVSEAKVTKVRVGSADEIRGKGCSVVHVEGHTLALFAVDGNIYAVDNRCPHMGFPLDRGSVHDGILTCHWHHARFDLCSGCAFDLWADDTPAFDTEVRDGTVYVSPFPRQPDRKEHHLRRLREGLEQDISLIQAKGLIGLQKAGVPAREAVAAVARFGLAHRDDWSSGMTILTAMANVVPHLGEETAFLALCHGASHVADDCAGQEPRRQRHALETDELDLETLQRWL